jgi:hypothetical protein
MLNAVELMKEGKLEYMTTGVKGAFEQMIAFFEANPIKDDPRIYGWLSALTLALRENLSLAEILDGVAPDEGMDDEKYWFHYLNP